MQDIAIYRRCKSIVRITYEVAESSIFNISLHGPSVAIGYIGLS